MIAYLRSLLLALVVFTSSVCTAQDYVGDVKQCIAKSATQQDKRALVRWIFAGMAAHPDTKDLASISPQEHDEVTMQATKVFVRLLTSDCVKEVSLAESHSGTSSIGSAFGPLWQLALQDLMDDPSVLKSVSELASGIDQKSRDKVTHSKP